MVFSASLAMLSAGMMTSAALSTETLLEPFQQGFDWASERGLAPGVSSLTVLVSSYDDGAIEPIAAAIVRVDRLDGLDDAAQDVAATGLTGHDGRVRFDLPSGHRFGGGYFVNVSHGGITDSEGTQLDEDVRMGVYLTPHGAAYWRTITHEDLEERRGDVARLGLRMRDHRLCDPPTAERGELCREIPPGSMHVAVHRLIDGRRTQQVYDAAKPGDDDAKLAPGNYEIVATYDGKQQTQRVLLLCDLYVFLNYDGQTIGLERPVDCAKTAVGVSS